MKAKRKEISVEEMYRRAVLNSRLYKFVRERAAKRAAARGKQ